jgi:uncharacterized membrane protein
LLACIFQLLENTQATHRRNGMNDIYKLLGEVRSDMQLDVYGFFKNDDEKHSIPEEVFAQIIAGIVTAYLIPLLGLDEKAKSANEWLKTKVNALKQSMSESSHDTRAIESKTRDAEQETATLLRQAAGKKLDDAHFSEAKRSLTSQLVLAGLGQHIAETTATTIDRRARAHLTQGI